VCAGEGHSIRNNKRILQEFTTTAEETAAEMEEEKDGLNKNREEEEAVGQRRGGARLQEEMNNNSIVSSLRVKVEDMEEEEEEDEERGRLQGLAMTPMETATLLLLSRIAMFNKVGKLGRRVYISVRKPYTPPPDSLRHLFDYTYFRPCIYFIP
jgi:hypothetical protein